MVMQSNSLAPANAASSVSTSSPRVRAGSGFISVPEVIQPAVRRAVAATRNGKIGVLGTQVTIASRSYDDAFAAAPQIELTTAACRSKAVSSRSSGMTPPRAGFGFWSHRGATDFSSALMARPAYGRRLTWPEPR